MIWCMFSMFGESNLVESFVFGQGRIQIPSLVCLFGLLTSKIYHVVMGLRFRRGVFVFVGVSSFCNGFRFCRGSSFS